MGKPRRTTKHEGELFLLENNNKAILEGPQKKHWSKHDIKSIRPLTENQQAMFQAYFQGSNVCAHGSAGTGKTYLALYLAMCDVLDGNRDQTHLMIIRSAVPTREVGFLPGTLEEKVSLYENPYRDLFADLFHRFSTYDDMKEVGLVRFVTTHSIRGLTWDNAVVVVDEGQNMTWHELDSVMTRVGSNTRVVFTGDFSQTDLNKNPRDKSGIERFIHVAAAMKEFASIQFTVDDIIRSDFVKSWIIAAERSSVVFKE